MAVSFVQFLNIGFGIINNTREIDKWNIEEAVESALLLDDPDTDVRIIGFRFYDQDENTGVIVKKSGVYYLGGELFTYPKVDTETESYLKHLGKDFARGQQIIKIKKPLLCVYPYASDDRIVNIQPFLAEIKKKKAQEKIIKIQDDIEMYKQRLVNELRMIESAIESNSFNRIPLISESEEVKHLNILNDGGNFEKHIEYLRNQRVELMKMEKEAL